MNDYRSDLMMIIQNIGSSPEELRRGQKILESVIHILADDTTKEELQAIEYSSDMAGQPSVINKPTLQATFDKWFSQGLALIETIIRDYWSGTEKIEPYLAELKEFYDGLTTQEQVACQQPYEWLNDALTSFKKRAVKKEEAVRNLQQTIHDVAAMLTIHPQDHKSVQQAWIKLAGNPLLDNGTRSVIKNLVERQTATQSNEQPNSDQAQVIFKHPALNQTNVYLAIQEDRGAKLVDKYGAQIFYCPEIMLRKYNAVTGDLVKTNTDGAIMAIVGHDTQDRVVSVWQSMPYALVEANKKTGQLYVQSDVFGHPLVINGKEGPHYLDLQKIGTMRVTKNSIIEVVWNKEGTLRIRWVHSSKTKQKLPHLSTTKHTKRKSKDNSTKTDQLLGITETLDLNLRGQRVGVYVGDRVHRVILERVIRKYHGRPQILDAVWEKPKHIRQQTRHLDIVILVQSIAKHRVSRALTKAVMQNHLKFAISTTVGANSIARALYRADHQLPAFEPSQQTITYPKRVAKIADPKIKEENDG